MDPINPRPRDRHGNGKGAKGAPGLKGAGQGTPGAFGRADLPKGGEAIVEDDSPLLGETGASGAIFIVGGMDFHASDPKAMLTAELFDTDKQKFEELPPLETAHGSHASAATAGGKLYLFGGGIRGETLTTCTAYNPGTGCWENMAPMPTPRSSSTAVTLAGQIYVLGGFEGKMSGNDLDTVERFQPKTNTWTKLPRNMMSPRSHACAAPAGMTLYVIGGFNTRGKSCLPNCERMAPRKGEWEEIAPMTIPRRGAGITTMKDQLFVAGGHDGTNELRAIEMYDPASGAWSSLPTPLPCARVSCLMVGVSGELYVFGGHNNKETLASGDRLAVSGEQLARLPSMRVPRSWCVGASWTWRKK